MFINYFFHVDVVHMSFLERIGLGSYLGLLFWAIVSIMALVVALAAEHLTHVFLGFRIGMGLSIVMIMASMSISPVSCMIPPESTIVVVTMGSVAASPMVIVSTMMISSSTMTMTIMGEKFLE